ncbi:MAG: metalloregulator ArsR/SmtB family transcription factor [Gammaproteobacteria bacterium]|nr:metalloregulator ArsR/SmtB family transcription factor [Gammaproteobacteria bacterium]NNC78208.1 metalloregulator ArsR/SmtB family transcription factor [Woeseiaceae bacterium]
MNTASEQLIAQFKALADPVRLRLLALCAHGECSVSELTTVLGQSQPRISQHLKTLGDAGLVERFRDGHFVYYRVPQRGDRAATRRRLLGLLPADEPDFARDAEKLRAIRGTVSADADEVGSDDRALYRALVELTVARPLGDLIDIGCGHGSLLKLLASRAQRAVGVDINADARRFARAELLLAGLPNCTLRQGDMHALPFSDGEFDTVILDDVLTEANRPVDAILEAKRLLRQGGHLLLLVSTSSAETNELSKALAKWCHAGDLRLSSPRAIPVKNPRWLLAVATRATTDAAAA